MALSATCPKAQRALNAALSSNLYFNLGYDCEWLLAQQVASEAQKTQRAAELAGVCCIQDV
jgi:hypothetical protein